jgi:hypothetical protein
LPRLNAGVRAESRELGCWREADIVARTEELLEFAAPIGRADLSGLRTAPFLR